MKREKPLILLSNDDGVEAKGLNELIRGLRGVGEMIVMAPDGPRSGASGAITSEHPVRYYKVREEEDLTVYKCTGTPVDCVKLALHTVVPRRPDVVIGGINHGDNSSVNVHYSGTMEMCIRDRPDGQRTLFEKRKPSEQLGIRHAKPNVHRSAICFVECIGFPLGRNSEYFTIQCYSPTIYFYF